jgi:DNA polymerase
MHAVTLSGPDDFDGWRDGARDLAARNVPPETVLWQVGSVAEDLFASAAEPVSPATRFAVPRETGT